MKEKLEIIEKLFLVLTLIASLVLSVWKGAEYVSAQSLVVKAKGAQEREIVNAQQLLTKTYSELLKKLDDDIRDIDSKLEEEVYEGTVGWEKLLIIRQSKVSDRSELIKLLGSQVTNVINPSLEIKPSPNELLNKEA